MGLIPLPSLALSPPRFFAEQLQPTQREIREERDRKVMMPTHEVKMRIGTNKPSFTANRTQKMRSHHSGPSAGGVQGWKNCGKRGCSPSVPAEGRCRAGFAAARGQSRGYCAGKSGSAATGAPWQGEETITPEGASSGAHPRPSLLSNLAVPRAEKSSGNCLPEPPCHPSTDSSGPFMGAKSQNQSPLKSGGKLTWNSMGFGQGI